MSVQMLGAIATLRRVRDAFDFSRDTFGGLVVATIADSIRETMDYQQAPDGSAWAPLSESYIESKQRIAPGEPMAVLYHRMKTTEQLKGLYTIERDKITMTYGVDEDARKEAEWFQEGSKKQNRPGREFYGFSNLSDLYLTQLFDRRWTEALGP